MSLLSFLEEMEKKEVRRVKGEVSLRFDVSSIMKALDGGPAS